jgi:hypothetical protein
MQLSGEHTLWDISSDAKTIQQFSDVKQFVHSLSDIPNGKNAQAGCLQPTSPTFAATLQDIDTSGLGICGEPDPRRGHAQSLCYMQYSFWHTFDHSLHKSALYSVFCSHDARGRGRPESKWSRRGCPTYQRIQLSFLRTLSKLARQAQT